MSSHDMMNPYGEVHMGRVVESFDPNERLLERILSKENVALAWKRVKANHGAPGADGITIEQFPDHTRSLWSEIRQSLLSGTYQQGGPLSPLLANILLDDLDKELEKRAHRFARYANDFIVLVKSRQAGERDMESLKRFLERRLKLRINQEKSRVVPTNQATFLGFTFRGTKIHWSEKAFREFSEAE